MVFYRNRYPVRIIGQMRGGIFSLVSRAEATRFQTEGEGWRAVLAAGMKPQHIFVQPVGNHKSAGNVRNCGEAGKNKL